MKIIIGLGNPGEKYQNTRHNVGWLVLEALANKYQILNIKYQNDNVKFKINKKFKSEICEVKIGGKKVILVKPQTFMNNSGQAVKKLIRTYNLSRRSRGSSIEASGEPRTLIVFHDDLDISLGKYKIQFGKGPKEHRGVESIEKTLKTKDFWRARIGVENKNTRTLEHNNTGTRRISGEKYVLQEFTKEEEKVIDQVILEVAEEIKRKLVQTQKRL